MRDITKLLLKIPLFNKNLLDITLISFFSSLIHLFSARCGNTVRRNNTSFFVGGATVMILFNKFPSSFRSNLLPVQLGFNYHITDTAIFLKFRSHVWRRRSKPKEWRQVLTAPAVAMMMNSCR